MFDDTESFCCPTINLGVNDGAKYDQNEVHKLGAMINSHIARFKAAIMKKQIYLVVPDLKVIYPSSYEFNRE